MGDIDWDSIQSSRESEIITKLSKYSANECTAFDAKIPKFFDLKDKINEELKLFITQFTEHVPIFNPQFHTDKIKDSYKKQFSTDFTDNNNNYLFLVDFFQKQIEIVKWKNKIIFDRFDSEYSFPKYHSFFEMYTKSSSDFLKQCELAICSAQSAQIETKYVELAIKYELLDYNRNFELKNLYSLFKMFPLIRRREILQIASNRFISDSENELDADALPAVIKDTEVLREELRRLANIMNIEFDIDSHDGQHFSYLCEKLYGKYVVMTVRTGESDDNIPLVEDPSFEDRLNFNFLNEVQIDTGIKVSFNNLVNPDPKGISIAMRKFSNQDIKDLTRDKVTALLRLQFARNKQLLHSIVDSVKKLGKVKYEIIGKNEEFDDEDENDFFEKQFPVFRRQILAASSAIKSSAKRIEIDNESLLELVLDLFDKHYKQKVLIINSLQEINRNSFAKTDILPLVNKYLELRPNLLCGIHSSCLTPFQLSLDILEKVSASLQTLINFQIYNNLKYGAENRDAYPWFEFPNLDSIYQKTKEQFPYSILDVYDCLSKIPDFLSTAESVANEVCTSFSVRSIKFLSYFRFATYSQLLLETRHMITDAIPETYSFNMKISDSVSKAMTSQVLNDFNFIRDKVHKQDSKIRSKYALKLRDMINLTRRLRKYLIKTDTLLPIYKRQNQNMAKNDIIDSVEFAYLKGTHYSFADGDFNEEWSPEELIKITKSQQNFFLSLAIAVRYNNFADDSKFISDFFEMNARGTGFTSRPTKVMIQHQQVLRGAPKQLFYEPELFKYQNDYSAIFSNVSQLAQNQDFSDSEQLIPVFLPFCIRSEIAFICGYERNFLQHYTNQDVFIVSSTEITSLYDNENKLNHFFVPTFAQALAMNKDAETLYKLLKFVTIRVQLLEYIRHESYITQSKPKTLENIYNETLLFATPFFSRLNVEINRYPKARELDFSIEYFDIERITYCAKQYLTALSMYESIMIPTEKLQYSLESMKSYFTDMLKPLKGRPAFLTHSLYIQKYLSQFWYQCNDQFRAEFLSQQSLIEQKIDDSIVGFNGSEYRINAYNFAIDWLRLSYLKLGYSWVLDTKDPSKVTILSSILGLTPQVYISGKAQYDTNVNVKSTTRIGHRPQVGTIETELLKERTNVLCEVISKLFSAYKEESVKEEIKKELGIIDEAFSAPNQMLKPECYSKRIQINSTHNTYLPTIASIKEQFLQETGYARSRFCHAVFRMLTLYKEESVTDSNENNNDNNNNNSDDVVVIKMDKIQKEIETISEMLSGFVTASQNKLKLTWTGYMSNLLAEYKDRAEQQAYLNMYIDTFIKRYNDTINFSLSTKNFKMFHSLSHLREEEKVVNQEHFLFEKKVTREIRAEYDLLVKDLREEIRKAKMKFIQSKNYIYEQAIGSIDRFLTNTTFVENVTNPEIAGKIVSEPIVVRDPIRRKWPRPPPQKKLSGEERMAETKGEIERLQTLRKKLRISTTLSCIGFSKIYSRMIAKVAEEKKGFSMTLWHSQRLFEEDMEGINSELHNAYLQLTKAEIEHENLANEIELSKQKNAKLLHWKEMHLRAADNIHKELKVLTDNSNSDVNVTNLLKKISEKQDELEMLDYENQQLEQEIEYEVREPMYQLDQMRRSLTRKMAQKAREVQSASDAPKRPVSEKGMTRLQELLRENIEIKEENEQMEAQIKDLETQLAEIPPETLPLLTDLFSADQPLSTRPKSTRQSKKIVRPGVGKAFIGASRPLTSRV